jgi:hypothetical protein
MDELLQSRNPDPATPSDVSQSQTRKIHALVYECAAEGDCTVVTSKSTGSKKRTASEAGIGSRVPSTHSKRQWGHPKTPFLTQAGTYAGEKLSDSHTTSHVVNLLVQGENLDIRVRSTQLTTWQMILFGFRGLIEKVSSSHHSLVSSSTFPSRLFCSSSYNGLDPVSGGRSRSSPQKSIPFRCTP